MAKKSKTMVNDTLDDFLFNKIKNDPAYQSWKVNNAIPEYVTDNLHPSKKLRDYQEEVLRHFIYLFEVDRESAKHLMVNMATGTGKTLVMASIVLYLYAQGYRNFLFLVHQVQIKNQAVRNLTDYKFEKYLFNPKGIKISGQKVEIKEVASVADALRNDINFMFFSTQLLYNRLKEDRENGLTADDFNQNDIVVIADEAHRLNVDTRSKSKKVQEEIMNWETAVMSAINARPDNMLVEFTATVDLANQAIHEKYQDKIVFRYDFMQFNRDGFSKDVRFLYNQEIHTEDQKRLLIINAVALSEYRKLLAEKEMGLYMTPILLVKSTKIAKSEEDREFFDTVINSLRPEDLNRLKELGQENTDREHEILSDMFAWIADENNSLVSSGDWDGLKSFVTSIRSSFARDHTMVYNSKKKERAELLTSLDSSRNTMRAIFSVNALNEGWDVLSLYDIIHFDISETKKVSLQDIQLIGRGARYMPYELPPSYQPDEVVQNQEGLFGSEFNVAKNFDFDKYKRKFDRQPHERARILETFVYHFVKTGTFLENLQKDLLGEGIINEGVEKKTITLKQHFLESETYKKGFVFVNKTEKRNKVLGEEIETTFNRIIKAGAYNLRARGLTDYEQNQIIGNQKIEVIRISEEYFSLELIRKALMSAEGNFFRFNNVSEHIFGMDTIDDLITKYLPRYEIKYIYEEGKGIDELSPQEKLQLLVGVILPEVRKAIDLGMPKVTGTKTFRPVALSQVFSKEKNIYLMSFPKEDPKTGKKIFVSSDERANAQSDHNNPGLRYNVQSADWHAYDENFGTSEEKLLVRYVASQMASLKKKYPGAEIYLIRNELDYWLFSPKDGRRFSPDYMLIINDIKNKKMYYQCLIEPKGGHLLDQDKWKEEALMGLRGEGQIVFDADKDDKSGYQEYLKRAKNHGYQEIKSLGLKFYNSDKRGESDFAMDFQDRLL